MKKLAISVSLVSIIAIIIWWRAPLIGNEWSKQTIYIGLLDVWYGTSKDDKAYAYVNVASVKNMPSSTGPGMKLEVYEGYFPLKEPQQVEWPFSINESNYKNYPEYIYTFQKDKSNNYYLVAID